MRTLRIFTVAIAVTSGGVFHRDAAAQGPQTPGSRPLATVAIPLHPYFRELRTVKAVRGADTLTFLFDTGGGETLISPALAARIGCRPYGREVGHRMHGDPVEFQLCDSIGFSLGGWAVRHAPVAVFDVNALLPPALGKLDGVLSLQTFRGQVVTIDWTRAELFVHSEEDIRPALRGQGVPARFATGDNGASFTALVPVHGLRGPLWFLLDSGDIAGTLVGPHVFRDSLLVIGSDSTIALRVGDREHGRISISISNINLDGVLGTAYLLRHPVSLDLRTEH
jgi:Aspartyl protease